MFLLLVLVFSLPFQLTDTFLVLFNILSRNMSKKTYEFNSCCQEFIPVLSLSQMVEKSPFLFRHLGKRRKKEKNIQNEKRKKY